MTWMYATAFANTFHNCFIKEDRYKLLLGGIGVTLKVSLIAVALGVLIGFLIALCNLSHSKILKTIGGIYTDVIRGTPSVTQLMLIYFVVFASVQIPKWIIAGIAFGINSGAYVSEIIRAGILSVDKGQTEAGRSLGLNAYQTMTRIVIPQAVKNIFPALCNEFITTVKGTSLASVFFVGELMTSYKSVQAATFLALQSLTIVGVIYFLLNFILSRLLRVLERRLTASD